MPAPNRQALQRLAAARRRLMGRKGLRRRPVRWAFPDNAERTYAAKLRAAVLRARAAVERILPLILSNVRRAQEQMPRADSLRQDDVDLDIQSLREAIVEAFGDDLFARELARDVTSGVAQFNKQQFDRVVQSVVGVNVFTPEPWLVQAIAAAGAENIQLITSIPQQLGTQVGALLGRAYAGGLRWEQLQADILKRFDVSQSRAELIARDQVGKFNGQLTALRQQSIGVTEYIWRTSLDERVRPEHAEREGEKFRWDKPPSDGHPGEPIQCRCFAEAVLPDDLVGA